MGQRRTRLILATGIGAVLVVAGIALIYWPLAFIAGGVAFIAVGVLSDDGG